MRKNDAGLTILERGDIVRIGKGKVLYTVFADELETGGFTVEIQSHNTGKSQIVNRDRLHLVESVQSVAYTAGCGVEELNFPEPIEEETPVYVEGAASEAELEYNRLVDEEPVKETSAYAKAVLFALNKLQKHVYAGTVSKTKKAKTRSLNRRQKASRKANR